MDRDRSARSRRPAVLLLGYGEVGRAFAARLTETADSLVVVDPVASASTEPLRLLAEIPHSLEAVDVVLAAVPAAASLTAATACAERPGGFLYVDCSTSARAAMQQAAARFEGRPSRFVDAAIMGSVDLNGADAPILVAGEAAEQAASVLTQMGLAATAMDRSQPGDASALKLLRSVVTKGLEAVAVEGFLAARAMGMERQLRDSLADIGRTSFPDFLDSIVCTHVSHAPRRLHEVEAVIAQLQEQRCDASVTQAVRALFGRTAAQIAGARERPAPDSADGALAWLEQGAS